MIPMMTRMVSVMSHRVRDFLDPLVKEEMSQDEEDGDKLLVMVEAENVVDEVVRGFF